MKEPIRLMIKPRAAPRPRLGKNGAYNESWYTQYKKDIVILIKQAKIPKGDYSQLYAIFGMPYPQVVKGGNKMKIEGLPHRIHSGDTDNITKGLKDAIQNAGLVEDDCSIYLNCCSKLWTKTGGYIEFYLE
jgi:Holliday junction resolvase RusA-like endonuclease